MRKNIIGVLTSLSSIAFIVIVIGSYVIVAQTPITGTWTSEMRTGESRKNKEEKADDAGKIQLNFERLTANGGHNQNGSSYLFEELQGLTRDQAQNGRVSFRLVREAGTIECEGTFVNGKGSGTFTFTGNRSFAEGMKARGFDFNPTERRTDNVVGVQVREKGSRESLEDRLLSAALINVTTALADDLKSVGFGELNVDDLFKAAIFKVDSKFMAEMQATGFPNLRMEDLVKARIFKIDADFVRKVSDMGFGTKDFEQLVKYSIFKVTPEYLSELKAAGFDNLSAEDVVKFRIFKVTPELLTNLKADGFTNLSSEEVVKFRIFNIDREFIQKAKSANPNVTVEDLVRMKIGVHRSKDDTN